MSSKHDFSALKLLKNETKTSDIDLGILAEANMIKASNLEEIQALFQILLGQLPQNILEILDRIYNITRIYPNDVSSMFPIEVLDVLFQLTNYPQFQSKIIEYLTLITCDGFQIYDYYVKINIFDFISKLFLDSSCPTDKITIVKFLNYVIRLYVNAEMQNDEEEDEEATTIDKILLNYHIFDHLFNLPRSHQIILEIIDIMSSLIPYHDLYERFIPFLVSLAMEKNYLTSHVFELLKKIIPNNCTDSLENFLFNDNFVNFLLSLLDSELKRQSIEMFEQIIYFGDDAIARISQFNIIDYIRGCLFDEDEKLVLAAISFFQALKYSTETDLPFIFSDFNLVEYCQNRSYEVTEKIVNLYLSYVCFYTREIIMSIINLDIIEFCCDLAKSNDSAQRSICLSLKMILHRIAIEDEFAEQIKDILAEYDLLDCVNEIDIAFQD